MNFKDFCGWHDRPDEVKRLQTFNPHRNFNVVGAGLGGSGKGKVVLLYDAVVKLLGEYNTRLQTIGDCVSMGSAEAVDCLKAVQIVLGNMPGQWLAETCTEFIYGVSRVLIGKGQLRGQDGSVGAWAAEGCKQYGTVVRQKYGNVDVSVYSGQRAKQWGDAGVPQELLPAAREHLVKSYSPITTYAQAIDALANGYPITVASNQGFGDQWGRPIRDEDGFLLPTLNWGHQLCCLGFDDSYHRPGVLIVNSWGRTWVSGPTRLGQPDGSFWVDADVFEKRMLSANDSFAYSNFDGYPPQKIDFSNLIRI